MLGWVGERRSELGCFSHMISQYRWKHSQGHASSYTQAPKQYSRSLTSPQALQT